MVDSCSDFYTWGSVGGVSASLLTLTATGTVAAVYAVASGGMATMNSVNSYRNGDYVMGTVNAVLAVTALGVGTSGMMRMGANAVNDLAPGTIVRSDTWWSALGRKADPAASTATLGAIGFQVNSITGAQANSQVGCVDR